MAITEKDRHHMLEALRRAIGEGPAMTLAEHLPPAGWGEVATRADLEHLRSWTELRFDAIDQKFDAIDQKFDAVDQKFDAVERRFDGLNHYIDARLYRALAAHLVASTTLTLAIVRFAA